jgi:hypothetical protein
MNDSNSPSLKRRWFQFSLRKLLVVIVVLCIGLGLYVKLLQGSLNDTRCVNALAGLMRVDDIKKGDPYRDPTDEWNRIIFVKLGNYRETEEGIEQLKGLTKLRTLHVWGLHVTDENWDNLQHALPNCEIHHVSAPSSWTD